MKRYRVHETCDAGHTTYRDFTRYVNAKKYFGTPVNKEGWEAFAIEAVELKPVSFETDYGFKGIMYNRI